MKKKDYLPAPGATPEKKPIAGTTGESTAYPPGKVKGELEKPEPSKREKRGAA